MASRTLLDLVQDILSSLDSDEVNDVNDTTESQQVVRIIKNSYFDVMGYTDFPETLDLFELNPSGDLDLPTVMFKPEAVSTVHWIKYNAIEEGETDANWVQVQYLDPLDFLDRTLSLKISESHVFQYTLERDLDDLELLGENNKAPTYWTSFNDHRIVFDAYNKDVDSTLRKSKTLCYGQLDLEFSWNNDFKFTLDNSQMTLLYNDAKATAFAELKQSVNAKAEKKMRQSLIKTQSNKRNLNPSSLTHYPNYGRK